MIYFLEVKATQKYSKIGCVTLLFLTASLVACNPAEQVNTQSTTPATEAGQSVEQSQTQNVPARNINTSLESDSVFTATDSDSINNAHLLHNVSATVYKDPNCGCCGKWIDHAEDAGMAVSVQHPEQLNLFKARYGVPQNMRSCHTTVTEDGYVFEGHIPLPNF